MTAQAAALLHDDALVPRVWVERNIIPVGFVTLRKWMRDGVFPSPAKCINYRRLWRVGDLRAWQGGRDTGWPFNAEIVEMCRARTRQAS